MENFFLPPPTLPTFRTLKRTVLESGRHWPTVAWTKRRGVAGEKERAGSTAKR